MLLSVNGLGLEFGSDEIFSNMTFNINPGERVALVGVNGAGKTSLLRILSGELEPSSGKVSKSGNLRVGYLPQQISEFPGGVLLEAVCAGSGDGAEALSREENSMLFWRKKGLATHQSWLNWQKCKTKSIQRKHTTWSQKPRLFCPGLAFQKRN